MANINNSPHYPTYGGIDIGVSRLNADSGFEIPPNGDGVSRFENKEIVLEEQEKDDPVVQKSAHSDKKENIRQPSAPLFGSFKKQGIVLLLVSLLLCASFFMPFVSVETKLENYSSYTVSFTSYELVHLGTGAFRSYSADEIMQTEEYEAYVFAKGNANIIIFNDRLTADDELVMSEYVKSAIRLHLVSDESDVKLNLIFTLIAATAYLVVACAATLLAVVGLLTCLIFGDDKGRTLIGYSSKFAIGLLISIPFYLLVLMQTVRFSRALDVANYANRGVSLAWGGILMAIALAAFVVYIVIKCYICAFRKRSAKRGFAERCRFCSLVCVILAAIAVLLPCVTVKTAARSASGANTDSCYLSVSELYEHSASDRRELKSSTSKISEDDFIATIIAAVYGRTDEPMASYTLNWVFFRYYSRMNVLFAIAGAAALLSIVALTLLALSLASSLLNSTPIKRKRTLLLLAWISTIAYLVVCILMSIIANVGLDDKVARHLLFYVGIGPVLSALFAVAAFVLLLLRVRKKTTREFDNPDVSFAPYII